MKISTTLRTWTTHRLLFFFFYYRSSTCFFTVFLNFDSSHYIHSKRTFGLDIWLPLYHDQCRWIHSHPPSYLAFSTRSQPFSLHSTSLPLLVSNLIISLSMRFNLFTIHGKRLFTYSLLIAFAFFSCSPSFRTEFLWMGFSFFFISLPFLF